MSKKIISITILSVIIFSYLPPIAYAGVLESTGKFTACAGSGIIAGQITASIGAAVSSAINTGLRSLASMIPGVGEFLSGLFGGGTQAVRDDNFIAVYKSKEYIQDVIARCAAREIFNKMSSDIVRLARTGGRDGGTTWIANWRNFQLQAQYRGENIFKGQLASTKLCDYFGNDLKNLFGANQRISLTKIRTRSNDFDSFQVRAGCTLPSDFDYNDYKRDFSGNGGWEAWSRLMEPQNNYYGVLFQSVDEANRQRAIEETADLNQALANDGFLGKSGDSAIDSCDNVGSNGKCIIYKDIKTPGGVIKASVDATFMQELAWIVSVDELNELIATGIEVMFNRLIDLSNPDEGEYRVPGEVDYDPNTLPEPPVPPEPIPPSEGSCQSVTEQGALNILQKYPPTDAGIQQGVTELQSIYDSQVFAFGTPGDALDKINFGGGMTADVISNAGTPSANWGWILLSACGSGGGGGSSGTQPASLLSDVQAERAKYGTPMTSAELGQLLNTVAWNNRDTGWGLSGKNFGNFCPSPAGSIACDILHHQPTNLIYDVFIDSEGAATPTWGSGKSPPDVNRPWVAPVQP